MGINRVAKGYRREKIIIDEYVKKGYWYYKPPRQMFGDNDVFNMFDIIVYHPQTGDLGFISVKSAYGSKKHKKELSEFKPKTTFVHLVEFRNKNKGNEKVTKF